MTPADIERLAEEAEFGLCEVEPVRVWECDLADLQRFAAALRAMHMEEAAARCDEIAGDNDNDHLDTLSVEECAAAIRALKSAP